MPSHAPRRHDEIEFARGVLREESAAVASLGDSLAGDAGGRFVAAVDLIEACAERGGTVLTSGLGKSGLIGAKISATFASLGVPSHSVHPSEAAHGDLGRFRACDTVLCISNSGETDEVVNLAAIVRQDGLPIISITCGPTGDEPGWAPRSLERLATVALRIGRLTEAGSSMAPTTTTTATLALGDALALAAARRRGFGAADFARRHPGGALGALLRPVTDLLRFVVGKNLPVIREDVTVESALREASVVARRPGALLLVDGGGVLSGILTDGDVRRLILRDRRELDRPAREVMTRAPRTLPHTALVRDAERMVREFRQDEIPVVDESGRPVGILDVQDLVAMRLVDGEQ
ncbi:MAG: KpsF/GutQ family sugar-phosphate isomerase [Phycisphaeraceae bacterium]|nr:MAG: KpsF/GutQ family sugar-phosphate isomerase [Phycisphaeraceae bacterium]